MLCHATKAGWRPGRWRLELACELLLSAGRDGEQVVLSRSLKKQLDFDVIHHESTPSIYLFVLMDVVFCKKASTCIVASPPSKDRTDLASLRCLFIQGRLNEYACIYFSKAVYVHQDTLTHIWSNWV